MINNPYSNVDDEALPLTPLIAPEPIAGDRGEPTTKSPKKRKTGVAIAIVAVVVFSLVAVGMFGYFFYNAVTKKSAASVVTTPDPALAPKESEGPDLGQFKDKVKKNNELALQRQREEAQAEAALKVVESAAAENVEPADATEGAPSRGRYAGQQQGAAGTDNRRSERRELTPKEIADARRFQDDVLWQGSGHGGGESDLAAGQANGRSQSPQTAEELLRANQLYAQGLGQNGAAANARPDETGGSFDSINDLQRTEKFANGSVVVRPDLKFLLIDGTNIPCTLIPRIVTDHPTTIRCMVNRDVYSADGSIVLIAKGSKARGERKVSLKAGQTMIYATWGNIDTTDGLKINTDSMSADNLGAAGINAIVDNHYGQRFGGAILLSFLDDVLKAAAKNNASTNGVNFDSSTQNAQDMASIALQNSINIAPTGYAQHATELNIIVARDIDFRSIYGVK